MILVNGEKIEQEHFPDGTFNMTKMQDIILNDNTIVITWKYENESENIFLYYITRFIKDTYNRAIIILQLPYLPNARMDRIKNPRNECFTLKYFCDFINSLNFDSVSVVDPHSNVGVALLNRCKVISYNTANNYLTALTKETPDVIFFPDEGSRKRYIDNRAIADYREHRPNVKIVYGEKKREWQTGEILGLEIHGDINEGDKVLIIDDISSYGGTFYYSAKALRELGAKRVSLAVTHCENNILKGAAYKEKMIDKVYTTDSIFTEDNEWVEVVK